MKRIASVIEHDYAGQNSSYRGIVISCRKPGISRTAFLLHVLRATTR